MKANDKQSGKAAVRGFYNAWGPIYTALRERGQNSHEDKSLLIDMLTPFENDSILDVGTGPGVYALRIASKAPECDIVGIDISPAFVKIAADRAADQGAGKPQFMVGDIESLGFRDSQFSKIICAGVISVIKDREAAVSEMARVLAPGGRLAVREPLRSDGAVSKFFSNRRPESRLRRLGSLTGFMFGHLSPDFMTEEDLRALFSNVGFSEVAFQRHSADLVILADK